jgi:hypothetical protein
MRRTELGGKSTAVSNDHSHTTLHPHTEGGTPVVSNDHSHTTPHPHTEEGVRLFLMWDGLSADLGSVQTAVMLSLILSLMCLIM